MKSVWNRLADQLDHIPSRWGVPLLVLTGLVFWIVALQVVRL
ncbi:hypothetical protein [Devosia insulae]|nr:hypothetical protein [Devosia insulae]